MNSDRSPGSARCKHFLLAVGMLAAVAVASTLAADSIYLKNGRVIRTSAVEIVGDRVLFIQFGHPVAIPMSQVDRIVEDDYEDPIVTPASPQPEAAAPPSPATASTGPGTAGTPRAPAAADPEQTKDYWQERVRAIHAEATMLALQMQNLRRIERAFLFSHRSTAEIRRRKEDLQARVDANDNALPALRTEARRKGIWPGWLRLPSGG
ncbi:MAG: hypothetical protein IH849_13805 [Acidobacteria bacterium]|nr:hypothetical protein [Acidobacteriota bacterium]